jgi:pentatricopeptide repeat protein
MIGSNLVDMYIKCGTILDAQKVFDDVIHRDVALWGTLIAGYAGYGDVDTACLCAERMKQDGLEPDEVIITSIVTACSQSGRLEEGHKCFNSMEIFYDGTSNIRNVEHYNGMVDLLTRSGSLEEALCLLQTMPILPDLVGWRCLLAGCRIYGNVSLAKHCFDELVRLDPSDSSTYILMIDVYTKAEMWEDVQRLNHHLRMNMQLEYKIEEAS